MIELKSSTKKEPEEAKKEEKSKPTEVAVDEPELDYGYFTAFTRPWARIIIDGKDTGKVTPIAPAGKIKLSVGKHRITFLVGEDKHDFSVTIKPGKITRLAKILDQ